MIELKDLFYAIAYCNQHIKTHKSECKKYKISPSRFYNIKLDIIRYLVSQQKTLNIEVIITSYEKQRQEPRDVELIGMLFRAQSSFDLHVHQLYSEYRDLIPGEALPELTDYVPGHTLEFEWNEQEFVRLFDIILNWGKQQKLENIYSDLPDSYFCQKLKRWYWNIDFWHERNSRVLCIKKERTPKGTGVQYNVKEFRKNATELLNKIEGLSLSK